MSEDDYREKMSRLSRERHPKLDQTLGFRVSPGLLGRLRALRQHLDSRRSTRVGIGEVTRSLILEGLDSWPAYTPCELGESINKTLGGFRVSSDFLERLHAYRNFAERGVDAPVSIGDVARTFLVAGLDRRGF